MTAICFVVSSRLTADTFLRRHIKGLASSHRVYLIANTSTSPSWTREAGVTVIPVPIERRIQPLRDLLALLLLLRLFRQHRFAVVHSVTPKAGLLSMIAAWLARVPVRLHTFTGQVWVTRKGPMRTLLREMDRMIGRLATGVLVDSHSQRAFLIANGVVLASKATVLGAGSICGVDERFRPNQTARDRTRSALNLPDHAVLFLYLGRLSRDKGVLDLAAAFAGLARQHSSAHLLIVGPDEEGLAKPLEDSLAHCRERLRRIDFTDEPERYMAAADVFCLPSYREGFGQVAIEASAAGLPVIASRIYGLTDAVAEGETGLLHAPGDVEGLSRHMRTLLAQPELRRSLGEAGSARALREFSADKVTQAWLDYYSEVTAKL